LSQSRPPPRGKNNTKPKKKPTWGGAAFIVVFLPPPPPPLQHSVCISKYVCVIHKCMKVLCSFIIGLSCSVLVTQIWFHMWLCSCLFMVSYSNIDIGVFTTNIMYLFNVKVKSIHFLHCISNRGAAFIWGMVSSICYEITYSVV